MASTSESSELSFGTHSMRFILICFSPVSLVTVCLTDPPDPPSIFGYQENTAIRAGTLQRLTCVVNGGNPIPTLKWFVRDDEIKSGAIVTTNGNIVSSELAVVTKDSDNGAEYQCRANNSATEDTPLTASIRLSVHCECKLHLSIHSL